MPGWSQFSFSSPLAAPCWPGAEYCLMNLPQGPNCPAAVLCHCPDSHGHVPALLSEVKDCRTLFLPAFLLQQGPERRAPWKEFVRNAPEVKDCLEEKAEVKIKNRKSARRVQTGAALSLGLRAIVGERGTQADFNWDQFHKYRLRHSPSADWKPNEAFVSGDRFFSDLPHLLSIQIRWDSELLEILC